MFKKKITGILCGAIILSSIGTVALAGNTPFNITAYLDRDEGRVYSDVGWKDDLDTYWYVNTTGGNLNYNDAGTFFYSMAKEDGDRVSSWNEVYSLGKRAFKYDWLLNLPGEYYKLLADTDRHTVNVSGTFCP
ncbi:hypothetical protein [Clostridium sp. UBA1056]|uniref:hypothetical protein n=1 Tax=Clostridium sp. UBA1056 TaxID=1946346 RepID=UPI003217500C